MKLRLLLSGAAVLALLPASALAVDVGTVNITGYVSPACTVDTQLAGTIVLGELEDPASGYLLSTLTGSTTAPTGKGNPTHVDGTVRCGGTAPIFHLSAVQLFNGDSSAPTGYTGRVNYTAHLRVYKADTTNQSTSYATADSPPAAQDLPMTGRIAGTANNVTVWIDNLDAGGLVLETGTYDRTPAITVTVSPS